MNENVKNKAEEIIKRFQAGKESEDERNILRNWFAQSNSKGYSYPISDQEKSDLLSKINQDIDKSKVIRLRIWRYAGIAALFVACLGCVFYYLFNIDVSNEPHVVVNEVTDVLPGKDEATLELADGRRIALNSNNTSLENLNGVKFNLSTGVISFEAITFDSNPINKEETTIKTKNGGQYTVILPDGSTAKLNAYSSISFANNFRTDRNVKISGEVFFDVKRDELHAFTVEAGYQNIKVLGTRFNVKSYPEEFITTTALISGSLLVRSSKQEFDKAYILKPGEIAKNGENEHLSIQSSVSGKEMAWAEGSFYFDGETVEEVLNVLARWYDVKIKYEYKPTENMHFGGVISRSRNLSIVLSLLEEQTGLKFNLIGKEVVVQK